MTLFLALVACVTVDHWRLDEERGCWEETKSIRSSRWWHGYGRLGGPCADLGWSAVDHDGSCISMSSYCNEVAPEDPHLGSCDDSPQCCDGTAANLPFCAD